MKGEEFTVCGQSFQKLKRIGVGKEMKNLLLLPVLFSSNVLEKCIMRLKKVN